MPRPAKTQSAEARADRSSAGNGTPEAKEHHRARSAYWTAEHKRAQADLTRQRMADPLVRQRIRAGMRSAALCAKAETDRLREAWSAARPSVRRDFLASIIGAGDGG